MHTSIKLLRTLCNRLTSNLDKSIPTRDFEFLLQLSSSSFSRAINAFTISPVDEAMLNIIHDLYNAEHYKMTWNREKYPRSENSVGLPFSMYSVMPNKVVYFNVFSRNTQDWFSFRLDTTPHTIIIDHTTLTCYCINTFAQNEIYLVPYIGYIQLYAIASPEHYELKMSIDDNMQYIETITDSMPLYDIIVDPILSYINKQEKQSEPIHTTSYFSSQPMSSGSKEPRDNQLHNIKVQMPNLEARHSPREHERASHIRTYSNGKQVVVRATTVNRGK